MDKQNIRIKLRAYDNKVLDQSTEEIVNTDKELVQILKDLFRYQQKLKDTQY